MYTERILGVLVFIHRNLDDRLPLEAYAKVAHFSPYHFHRIFRGMVGESLAEHIRRLRLERAAMRLRHTDWAIIEIALEAGYEAHEAFTRAFRALWGLQPITLPAGQERDARRRLRSRALPGERICQSSAITHRR